MIYRVIVEGTTMVMADTADEAERIVMNDLSETDITNAFVVIKIEEVD